MKSPYTSYYIIIIQDVSKVPVHPQEHEYVSHCRLTFTTRFKWFKEGIGHGNIQFGGTQIMCDIWAVCIKIQISLITLYNIYFLLDTNFLITLYKIPSLVDININSTSVDVHYTSLQSPWRVVCSSSTKWAEFNLFFLSSIPCKAVCSGKGGDYVWYNCILYEVLKT